MVLARQILGGVLISIPFIFTGWLVIRENGWKAFLQLFGITFGVVLLITTGSILIFGV